jgi:hypothetical protein
MKKWKQLVLMFTLVMGVGMVVLPPPNAAAINVFSQCSSNSSSAVCKAQGDSLTKMIQIIINILLYVLGATAVVMIVIGGIRYTTSNGESSAIASAKNTILYSVIGLIVAILSYTIVNFVLSWFK